MFRYFVSYKLSRADWLLLIAMMAIAVLIYSPGLGTFYYSDDYCHLKAGDFTLATLLGYFQGEGISFLRPFEAIIQHSTQYYLGLDTWPIQLFNTLSHGVSAWLLCGGIARQAGRSERTGTQLVVPGRACRPDGRSA